MQKITCPLARGRRAKRAGGYYRFKAQMRLTDKSFSGLVTLSERKSSPKCGELRECGEGMSSRYKTIMTVKILEVGFGTGQI